MKKIKHKTFNENKKYFDFIKRNNIEVQEVKYKDKKIVLSYCAKPGRPKKVKEPNNSKIISYRNFRYGSII